MSPDGWPAALPRPSRLLGWLRRGPNYEQRFQGWEVFAERQRPDDLPVTIIPGHTRESACE